MYLFILQAYIEFKRKKFTRQFDIRIYKTKMNVITVCKF